MLSGMIVSTLYDRSGIFFGQAGGCRGLALPVDCLPNGKLKKTLILLLAAFLWSPGAYATTYSGRLSTALYSF